jgi:hypothetical protein
MPPPDGVGLPWHDSTAPLPLGLMNTVCNYHIQQWKCEYREWPATVTHLAERSIGALTEGLPVVKY